jgi:hypothetical protein
MHEDTEWKIFRLEKENERFRKIFWLAAQDELFFSQWNDKLKNWDNEWHPAINCNDFFYAAADAEGIPEDEHLDKTLDLLIELYNKFSHCGPLAWISLRRNNLDPPDWRRDRMKEEDKKMYNEAKEWLKTKNIPIVSDNKEE